MHQMASPVRTCVVLAMAALFVSGSPVCAQSTWIAQDGKWSNPLNWNPSGLPAPASHLTFPGSNYVVDQDIASGVSVGNLTLTGQSQTISGNPIQLADQTTVSARMQSTIESELVLAGSTVVGGGGVGQQSSLLRRVSGPGSLTIAGHVFLFESTHEGQTTVLPGHALWLGGRRTFADPIIPGKTSGQGDWLIQQNAALHGLGRIGLAPGAAVRVSGGYITPDIGASIGLDPATITIDGDLIFEDGGTFDAYASDGSSGNYHDLLKVNGLLDLRSNSDVLHGIASSINPLMEWPVIEYQNRLGEFDVLQGLPSLRFYVKYTSAENSGPGKVIIALPEPGSLVSAGFATMLVLVRRRLS